MLYYNILKNKNKIEKQQMEVACHDDRKHFFSICNDNNHNHCLSDIQVGTLSK